jgi:hypothetical protein
VEGSHAEAPERLVTDRPLTWSMDRVGLMARGTDPAATDVPEDTKRVLVRVEEVDLVVMPPLTSVAPQRVGFGRGVLEHVRLEGRESRSGGLGRDRDT